VKLAYTTIVVEPDVATIVNASGLPISRDLAVVWCGLELKVEIFKGFGYKRTAIS